MTDAEATRRTALLNIMAGYCGETLTPDRVQ